MTTPYIPQADPAPHGGSPARTARRMTIALALAAVPAVAPAGPATITEAVAVRIAPLHADTPADARRLLARLGRAAEQACGASPGSLRDVQAAVRASGCWHEALGDAVRRLDRPALTRAFTDIRSIRRTQTAATCTKEPPCPAPSN